MADEVAIIAHGRLVRAGPLDRLLGDSSEVRVRVPPAEAPRAAELLAHVAADVHADGHGPGWLSVAAPPAQAAELNRVLVGAGVDVSGLEVGSDLESMFLSLTEGS
jgi:ABC-2 type transport system ATP-binding protein